VYKAKPPKRFSDWTSLSEGLKETNDNAMKAPIAIIDLIFMVTVLKFLLKVQFNVFI
jgi:hypothetical protein